MEEKFGYTFVVEISMDIAYIEYYPISLEAIKEKVSRKNERENTNSAQYLLFEDVGCSTVKEQVNEFGEKIIRVDGDIPVDLPLSEGQRFLFISHEQTALTHGLHKYPAKFFPELPGWLIKRYSDEYNIVIDPFAGSGTTNVEALLNRRHSVGIDVDPFSRYLSKVKTTPLDEGVLNWSLEELLRMIVDFSPSLVDEKDIPDFPYRDNWFNKEIILELAYIKKKIEELDVDQDIKDFYRICFSSIIRSVSNADDNCTRTVIRKKLNKKVYPSDALTKFAETILINVPKMIEFSMKCPTDVKVEIPVDSDARDIKYPDDYFDLAVTSPPYANAVDYPRTHQLEIYWLGFASGSLTPLKRKHVGTESVTAKEYRTPHTIGIQEADSVISKIYEKDPRRAYIAYKYLCDMKENLREVYRVLKNGGRYVMVVGNNRIRGEVFENWLYIMKLAEELGFKLETYFASEIIKHFIKVPREERIDTDWILVLQKK
ncbi:site-specific DNA-methyltransferase [Candidatus Poribacteria bacterium]|nr:site-specific DNA-methyltransferase [Candidatus Poribacteria bacterium]